MKRKLVTGIMLTLLLTGMLTLTFNIQPVKASGTIYITSNYTFTHDIYEPIVVLADNIVIDGNGYILQGTGSGKGINVNGRSNVTIKNMKIEAFDHGVYLGSFSNNNIVSGNNITNNADGVCLWGYSSNNIVSGNHITNNWWGVYLESFSNNNIVSGNNIRNNADGVYFHRYSSNNIVSGNNITDNIYMGVYLLWYCSNNTISGNNITDNNYSGVGFIESSNSTFYHNNFIRNTRQVYWYWGHTNVWDDGYPSGGNYWSDHVTVDEYSGINQNEPGSDGIVDEPYVIDDDNRDNYPLVNPWSPTPPVISATIDIDPDTLNLKSKGQWTTAYIQLPEEYNPEDLDATTILLNETIQPVLDQKYDFVTNSSEYIVDHEGDGVLERMVKFNRTEVASWICNDLGIEYGNVTLTITGEVDGTQFEGTDTIKVLFPGDADDDGDVDYSDLYILSRLHGISIENPSYNPLADFNEDEHIDSEDLLILSENYGKTAV